MHTPLLLSLSRSATAYARLILLFIALPCLGLQAASAQTGLTLPPFQPIVTVSPAVADVGVTRTITVSASWPDACVPANPVFREAGVQNVDSINITFTVPQTLVACAQVVTPYSANLTVTPNQAGVLPVSITLSDGRYLGGGSMVVQAPGQIHSALDLTGAWHDPATAGSGLSLFHSHAATDVLAGSWYAFDSGGKPFWYLIQGGRWTSDSTFIGQLVEVQSFAGPCPITLPACARTQQSTRIAANISFRILALDRIRVTVTPFGEVTPAVILADFEASRLRF